MNRRDPGPVCRFAFTLVELLVVIAIVGALCALLLPALSQSRGKAQSTTCANNLRQLVMAWGLYADDHRETLVSNHGVPQTLEERQNWVNNVQDWEASDDNTNSSLVTGGKLGPYANRSVAIFKCPADRVQAPNGARLRSVAMNAMVGDSGREAGRFNPEFRQFEKATDFMQPARVFVFLDEHADTLNDGFFVNRLAENTWGNLPGSYHGGAANLVFADTHLEPRRWMAMGTVRPVLKMRLDRIPAEGSVDFEWLKARTSLPR